ncbi:hypothetical protein ISN44_As09g033220 [Arabidopsis suecica]|uniref:Uncharacterized protein n=1 Tax=Arabidopsis suecica TaxID=45249 RepID=A0A8T2AN20_ARASU|nr:hypothetical protein ISN44_As09g033220 [Arabidopsis suecica]
MLMQDLVQSLQFFIHVMLEIQPERRRGLVISITVPHYAKNFALMEV